MYETFFGFKECPFNVTPDPRFIFFSRQHTEAFSSLLYGIESRKGFIAVTGEIGAGKTTLCRLLLEKLKGRAKTSLILNPNLSESELLLSVVEDFGVGVRRSLYPQAAAKDSTLLILPPVSGNKKRYFDLLNRFLLHEFEQGSNAVLIIDEAQDLKTRSLEQIRLLSNLETDKHKLLQIILVGQPELRDTLNSPDLEQLRQRIVVSYHLRNLDLNDTKAYVIHRLRVVGWMEEMLTFDASAFEAIYRYTEGIPRLINVLCDRALLSAYSRGIRVVTASNVEEAKTDLAWMPEMASAA